MIQFFLKCGPYGWLLLAMTLTNGVLVTLTLMKVLGGGDRPAPGLQHRLNSILFWGIIAAVTGLLGQYHGIYNGLNAIIKATEISPNVIAMGFAESFTTTLWGLVLFVVSAVVWLLLGGPVRKLDGARF
jgi:hypothetical protein